MCADGEIPLHLLAEKLTNEEQYSVFKFLVEKGADLKKIDHLGRTALEIAILNPHISADIISELIMIDGILDAKDYVKVIADYMPRMRQEMRQEMQRLIKIAFLIDQQRHSPDFDAIIPFMDVFNMSEIFMLQQTKSNALTFIKSAPLEATKPTEEDSTSLHYLFAWQTYLGVDQINFGDIAVSELNIPSKRFALDLLDLLKEVDLDESTLPVTVFLNLKSTKEELTPETLKAFKIIFDVN